MKIAWFTPFNKKSAIGKYSKSAALALSKHADVDIFVFDTSDLHETSLQTIHYDMNNVQPLLSDYDFCIYNMGDYSVYHGIIYNVMQQKKGIIISHDLCLHNFFRGYYFINLENPEEYVRILTEMYGGRNARTILDAANNSSTWSNLNLLNYHMTEKLFPFSLGFVVHSNYHANILKNSFHSPICVVPLLYENDFISNNISTGFYKHDSSKINLLTVGNVNPNKRVHATIEAIGNNSKLRKSARLTCIGALDNEPYAEQLRKQIKEMQIDENVELLGFVDDCQLATYYANADVVINLRFPAYEGGSASLLEQMQLGKIVIVSDTGVYSEIPDDCIIKINPHNETKELKRALLDVLKNPMKYKQFGKNAKSYAENNFTSDIYGKKLYDFIKFVNFNAPLCSLTDLLGQELKNMNVSSDMTICETLATEVGVLFK